MFARMTETVTKHSKMVVAIWLVIVVCCVPFMLKADSVLEYELTNMKGNDSESAQGNELMEENFSNSVSMDEVLVIRYTSGQKTDVEALASEVGDLLHAKYGETGGKANVTITNVGSYGDADLIMLYSIGALDEDFDYSTETGEIRDIVAQAKKVTGQSFETYVTGNAALTYDTMTSANGDIAKIDPISVALIFILLALFFGALVTAVVPPIGFGVAYAVAMLSLYLFGSMTSVFYLTSTLMMVTMLGAGCDYGIFIITRYREELKKGEDHHTALTTAIEWAGESVFTSGMSVIIGFACLAICDFSLVRNMGIMLAAGIVFALISALTFVPALVNLIGEKVFWPNRIEKYKGVDDGTNTGAYAKASKVFGGYFKWVARVTRKHALAIVAVAVVISVPTTYVYATTESSYDMISVEPDGEAKEGLYTFMDHTYGGTLMPTYVVVEFPSTAMDGKGLVNLGGTDCPYMSWTAQGLTIDGTNITGFVPAVMQISNELSEAHSDIVATASGLNSWAVLFAKGYQTVYTTAYEQAYPATLQAIISSDPSLTEEQAAAMAATQAATTAKTVADGKTAEINAALVEKMPSAVKGYVQKYVEDVGAIAGAGNVTPDLTVGTDKADTTKPVYFANLIDYVLNVGTGLLSDDGKMVSIMVVTTEKPMSDNTMNFVATLQDAFHGDGGYDSVYSTVIANSYVCGTNAVMHDISGTVSKQFDVIQIVVIILLLILLFLILGCYLTPIRALICIMASVIWTLALTHVVFQNILDIPVCWIVPIVLFVVLLGLGMDYDIFITTRVRENRVRGMSNDDAIDSAICSASGTISLCALIMGGTFLTLLVGSSSMLQEFGFALGIGILIDGLFMVTFVGPAAMHLMGEYSWKGPAFLQKKQRNE